MTYPSPTRGDPNRSPDWRERPAPGRSRPNRPPSRGCHHHHHPLEEHSAAGRHLQRAARRRRGGRHGQLLSPAARWPDRPHRGWGHREPLGIQPLGRPVVKAFNNIYARHLLERGEPKGTAGRIALPVAGDDPRSKDVVIRLLDELGFDGVDAGGLNESWRQQPATPYYGTDFNAAGVGRRWPRRSRSADPSSGRRSAAPPASARRYQSRLS